MQGVERMWDKLLRKDARIEHNGGIFEINGLRAGDYDQIAAAYDRLMSGTFYNRVMWGNHPDNYRNFVAESINQKNQGVVIDVGCGTLSFTHEVYNQYHHRTLVLSDLSRGMLLLGKNRIHGKEQDNKVFLRADATGLPFNNESIASVLCSGVLHLFPDPQKLANEFHRILQPGGDLHLSSLCTDRWFSARYLNFLKKHNHVAQCMRGAEIERIISDAGFRAEAEVIGGMTYIYAEKI